MLQGGEDAEAAGEEGGGGEGGGGRGPAGHLLQALPGGGAPTSCTPQALRRQVQVTEYGPLSKGVKDQTSKLLSK